MYCIVMINYAIQVDCVSKLKIQGTSLNMLWRRYLQKTRYYCALNYNIQKSLNFINLKKD